MIHSKESLCLKANFTCFFCTFLIMFKSSIQNLWFCYIKIFFPINFLTKLIFYYLVYE